MLKNRIRAFFWEKSIIIQNLILFASSDFNKISTRFQQDFSSLSTQSQSNDLDNE